MSPLFNLFIVDPMINGLTLLYLIFFNQFWLAIIVFTVMVRLGTLPLTLKQMRQMKTMTSISPRIKEIQERYGKDRTRVSQETMKMYKEAGVNPLGCVGPMAIQLPIWIGLFQALRKTLPTAPDSLIGLSQRLYSWLPVHGTVPLDAGFLWLDLSEPDPSPLIMPILVGASTWAQQKMTSMPAMDERQASTNRMMLWMMPMMLGVFTLQFPSGLALYWITSNLIGVGIQYWMTGWDPLLKGATTARATLPTDAPDTETKENDTNGSSGKVRKNRRRSYRAGTDGTRRRTTRGRGRDSKPR